MAIAHTGCASSLFNCSCCPRRASTMLIVVSASPFGFGSFDINLIIRAHLTAPNRRCVSDGPGLGKTCKPQRSAFVPERVIPQKPPAAAPIRTCWPTNVNGWGIALAPQSHLAQPCRPAGLFFVVKASRLHEETPEHIDLPQLRDDLFRLVSLPCHCSPP